MATCRTHILVLIFLLSSLILKSQDYTFDGLTSIEGISQNYVSGMQTDTIGNFYVYGNFKDSIKLDNQTIYSEGDFDFFIAKYSPEGEMIWVKNYGSPGYENITSAAIDQKGNIYIAGNFMQALVFESDTLFAETFLDNFLIKYDSFGRIIFKKNIGATSKTNEIFVKILSDNAVLLAGSFYDTVNFQANVLESQGEGDIFIFKLAEDGTITDFVQTGGVGNIKLNDLLADEDNNIYIGGYFEKNVLLHNDSISSFGRKDAFVLKYNSELEPEWSKHLGCMLDAEVVKLALNTKGQLIVAGEFRKKLKVKENKILKSKGAKDIFKLIYASNGKLKNSKRIGGKMNEEIYALQIDNVGNTLISGSFCGKLKIKNITINSQNENDDLFMAKFDNRNKLKDLVQFGGRQQDYISTTAQGADSSMYIAGGFDKNFTFNPDSLNTGNEKDIFIIKLSKCSEPEYANNNIFNRENNAVTVSPFYDEHESIGSENELTPSQDTIFNTEKAEAKDTADKPNQDLNIEIFPNPSAGEFTMLLRNTSKATAIQYEIYTYEGRLLIRKNTKNMIEEIDLKEQATGSYFLRVKNNQNIIDKTLVIIK